MGYSTVCTSELTPFINVQQNKGMVTVSLGDIKIWCSCITHLLVSYRGAFYATLIRMNAVEYSMAYHHMDM